MGPEDLLSKERHCDCPGGSSFQKNCVEPKCQDLGISPYNKEMECRTKLGQLLRKGSQSTLSNSGDLTETEEKYWTAPKNSAQLFLRECSVVLIVLETLILLLGYCVLVGLHLSIRYAYRFFRGKKVEESPYDQLHEDWLDEPQQMNIIPHQSVPRRMARG